MLRLLLLLSVAIGAALGQKCNTCHDDNVINVQDVINDVLDKTDEDGNNIITLNEFKDHLLTQWDKDNDTQVTQTEFVYQWCKEYCDNRFATLGLFLNLDKVLPKNILTELDLTHHILVTGALDFDIWGTQTATRHAVNTFLLKMHPDTASLYE